ncbi:metalloregulator ArsR/SmtB family transcription factor [Cellulomonas sp. URHD0024]|uniref:ArsR/SmtB family transcription factor n=1 Tax=Cellulomonas sp. URHD0024 TaxID=1302620 RepID=UPI0009DBE22E|nr:metalloregulator ArsR/SmtB family transcription factor [Cellulomonas sp. URHD0024]
MRDTGAVPLDLLPVISTPDDAACCTPLARAAITEQDAGELAQKLKALADPARLRLLSLIAAHDGGEACVCDLIEPVGLSQPTVSHHLKYLVDTGLLAREKRGVWAYYSLIPGALDAITHQLGTHLTAGALA